MNAFKHEKDLRKIIIDCYRKFKSYAYYSTNLHYLKLKIAEFENDKNTMEDCFDRLVELLSSKNNKLDRQFLDTVDYKVFPKISGVKRDNDSQIISNFFDNDDCIYTEKVNLFIDASIEVFILDTLWTLIIGKILTEKKIINKHLRANVFSKHIFINNELNVLKGINFKSLEVYVPYFKNYKRWKNGAIHKIEKLYDRGIDSTLISLDLSNYFYSVDFSFERLNDLLSIEEDNRYRSFSILNKYIKSLYTTYSKKISEIRTDVENNTLIPIGLVSSGVLANLYLKDFDEKVSSLKNINYYSRYVDDILIVIPKAQENIPLRQIIFENFHNIMIEDSPGTYSIMGHKKLIFQNQKIKVLKTFASKSKSYISILKDEISNTSESHLLPDIGLDLSKFSQNVYAKNGDQLKIRELGILDVDKLNLMKFISSYLKSKKNTSDTTVPIKKIKKNLTQYEKIDAETQEQLKLFFSKKNLFQIYAKWERVFYFAMLNNNDFSLGFSIYKEILEAINSLNGKFENINHRKYRTINEKMKKSLKEILNISVAMTLAIRYDKIEFHKSFAQRNTLLTMARKIQNSNMFDNSLVAFPMINFYKAPSQKEHLYYGITFEEFGKRYSKSIIDEFKIKYAPRFIHFQEYCISRNILLVDRINDYQFVNNMINSYMDILNHFSEVGDNGLKISLDHTSHKIYPVTQITATSSAESPNLNEIYIALANMDLAKHKIVGSGGTIDFNHCSFERKNELYKLLNDSYINARTREWKPIFSRKRTIERITFSERTIKRPVKFLVFPEVSIPIEWLNDVAEFARKSGIAIICGIKHFKRENRVYNCVATIFPVSSHKGGYKNAFVLLREKNDYSPDEKLLLEKNRLIYNTSKISYNNIFLWDNISFAVFNCYELTDIYARAVMKSNLDILFAPEYNKDIKYFSNIIESSSRDIYCFVAQVNSSHFGDTRIIAPFKEDYKCVASINGGEKDSIHIGKINIQEFRDYQQFEMMPEYKQFLNAKIYLEKKTKKDKNYKFLKYKKTSARHNNNR